MAQTRQNIEQVFARLGIGQQTSLPGLSGVSGSSLPKLPGLSGASPLMQSTASPTPPTGFMQQLGYGVTSPIRMGGERLGLMDASPAPTNIGGWAGNIIGNLVGWGAVTALTMATFGTGTVALLGIPAGTFAATAVSAGVSGGLVGAYGGWAKDEGVDEIVKGAAIGAATDLAFLGAGKAFRGLKNAKALKVDTALAASKGLDPTDVLGQFNPSRLSNVMQSMQPEIVDDIFAKTAKVAQKYNLGPQQAKYMGTKEKLKYLGELVNNFNTYDKDIYQPLAQYANDLLLRGKYSSSVVKGEATSLGHLSNNFKRILKRTAPDTTQGDYKTHESRLWKEYKAVIAKTKVLGGNAFRKTTGIKEIDDLLKNPEKAASEGRFVRISYMAPDEFDNYAKGLKNTQIKEIPEGTVVAESAKALAKTIADPKGKKMNMPVLDFEKGLIEGTNYAEAAKQAGIKGIPVAVLTPDPDHPAFQSIPLHDDLDQLPLLLKRLGVEDKLIDKAVQRALPFDQKESVWDQMVTLENEIRGAKRGVNAIYERNKVSSFEELNKELQRHFVLLQDARGDTKAHNALRRKIKSIQKDIESWKYYVKHTDDMDVRRQKLIPYVENILGLEQRGQMESAINDLLPSDPNVTRVTKATYREPVKNFLEKHKVTSLRQVNWKSKPIMDEWKQIVAESKRTGVPLVDTMRIDQVTPTAYDHMAGELKKLPLAPEKALTTSDVEKLGKPFNPFSVLDWLPRNRLTEPVFRRIRNADIQKKEFVHSYKQAVADTIGEKFMKPTKAAREFRKQIAHYMENPNLMDIDAVGDDIRTRVTKLRDLFNMLGAQEFKVEGWIDDEGKKYIPHIMKQYKSGTGLGLTPKDLRPGFKLERTGEMVEEIREMDIWRLFSYYIEAGAREKFYQPVFDSLDPLFGLRPRKGAEVAKGAKRIAHETQTQYYKHLKAKMIGVPDGVEQNFDAFIDKWLPDFAKEIMGIEGSERYATQISGFLSEFAYSGTLGYNPFSAIKNLTQQISAVSHLDDNPLVGMDYWWKARRMMSTKEGQQILENFNIVRTGRNPQEALDLQMLAMSNIPGMGKLQKGAFKMFQWADSQNIDTSWMMKFLYERDRGFALKEAVESAYSFTMATQFMYGIDSPLFFKGPVGKQVGMLMSWPLNFAAELQQLGQTGEWNKAVIMLASYAFGAEALSMTGLSFRSIHPVEVAKGFLPVAMLEGDQNMPIPVRLLNAGYDWAKTWAGADEGEKEKAWDSLKRAARAFVPYSTQGKRILNTLEAARNDFKIHERTFLSQLTNSDNGKGRLKYEMTKAEALLGLIGPTTNAYNRWQALENVAASESAYRRLRAQTIDAFLKEDYDLFMDKMTELRARFGGKVNIGDIQQEIELRSMTNLERRATSLPESMRAHFTN